MSEASDRRELILYATPTGVLGEQCQSYFDHVELQLDQTTAQTYPPHITLTGFFRRAPLRAHEVIAEMGCQITAAGPVQADAVTVGDMTITEDWVGLPITSPWLIDLTAGIIGAHQLQPDDDPVRPKDWLHLSLAYGDRGSHPSLEPFGRLAESMIDPTASVTWDVAVWERLGEAGGRLNWHRHTS